MTFFLLKWNTKCMSGPYPPSDSFVIITILSKRLDILPKIFQKIIYRSFMNERGKFYVFTMTFDLSAVIESMIIFFSTIVNNFNENRCSMMSKSEVKKFVLHFFILR